MIIDGKKVANGIKKDIKQKIDLYNNTPGLGIILVGCRKDSQTYVKMKKKACSEVGIKNFDVLLPENIDENDLIEEIEKMNNNKNIHGILVQLPLPSHINSNYVLEKVKRNKDIDGFHSSNIGKLTLNQDAMWPCTPAGCIYLLNYYNINISGQNVVMVGRSNIVGIPLALLLLHKNATVTICHSKTKNIKKITREADILIAACGQAKMITSDWIKEGVVILDVGINYKDNKLVGDVDFKDVYDKTYAISPVPGGVGPMTIAMLLNNTLKAFTKI